MTSLLVVQPPTPAAFLTRATIDALETEGFQITFAPSLTAALRLLEESVFDAALVDLSCRDSNGVRAVTALRRLAPRLSVVVLLEQGHEALGARAISMGARDFLVKRHGQASLVARVLRHAIELDRAETERLQILETLRATNARCLSLFENAIVGMAFTTFGGRLTSVNTALCTMLGASEEELLETSIAALVEPGTAPPDWSVLDRLRDGGLADMEIETRFRYAKHPAIWGQANISAVRDARGVPLHLVFKLRDITRRKLAEESMRRSQEESRLILETANDAFISADERGTIIDWNTRAERMFGWPRELAIGLSLAETIVPPHLLELHERALQRFRETGQFSMDRHFETPARHRDGHLLPVEITVWPVSSQTGTRLNAFLRDISERQHAQAALRESEVRFRAIFEGSSIGMAISSIGGRIVASNPMLRKLLGYDVEELVGKSYVDLVHPDDANIKDPERLDLLSGKRENYVAERRYRRKDGGFIWLRVSASLVRDSQGRPEFIVNVLEDLTERKQAETALREKAMQLVELVAAASTEASTVEEVLEICLHHVCSRIGWPVGHVFLTASGDARKLESTELWHLDDPERFAEFRAATMPLRLDLGEELPGQVFASGRPVWITDMAQFAGTRRAEAARQAGIKGAIGSPLLMGDRVIGVLEFFSTEALAPDQDLQNAIAEVGHQLGRVVERKRVDAFYTYRALHDPLTDLPNRMLFVDRLRQALGRIERRGSGVALLFVDLDGFKDVNDTFGHDVGDAVLITLGERIRALLRPGDTVSRFGGDEFTVLCEDLADQSQAVAIAKRILEVFAEPVPFEEMKLVVTPSIGIALSKGPDERAETLIRNADAAMYRAKERGGSCFQIFDERLSKRVARRRGLELSLRRAIEADQLRLFYQPCIGLHDGRVTGLEALVRWEHPQRGLLKPKDFISLAEDTGLIIPIGQWVFREACRQRSRWREQFPGQRLPDLSVNLSSRQLSYSELHEWLSETIEECDMDAGQLCLEITETVLLDEEAALGELRKLRALGVALSIDDFGTGYSSLTCLKRLPVSQIKLDRTFVSGLGTVEQDAAIVGGVIDMAHALGLTVVAEGVENQAQLERLKILRCDSAQGYYFSTPQPAEGATAFMMAYGSLQAA
jgi:diguanylate cyclase (GGDEF)-like protein/PAS domain S-box-containing protein